MCLPMVNGMSPFSAPILTDEYYRLGGFSAVLGGVDQGVVGRPREFGISLTMQFD